MRRSLGVLAIVAFAAACNDAPTALQPLRPQASAVAGVAHFSFLPPLAEAVVDGEFDPNLFPAVEVCHLVAGACAERLARFRTDSGQVAVDLRNQYYAVNWKIGGVTAGQLYRIVVRSGPAANASPLGFIDLVGTPGGGLADPDTELSRNVQSTLPIRFRIEQGILCTTYLPDPTASEPCLVGLVGPFGGTFATADSLAGAYFPPGAVNEWVNVIIERYEPFGTGTDALCLPTYYPQYGGCYRFRTDPDLPGFDETVIVGVCPDPDVFEQGIFDQVDLYRWDEITGDPIEYLPPYQVSFLNCPGTPYYTPHAMAGGLAGSRWFDPFRQLAGIVRPAPLYAGVISPFGGGLKDFSRIGWVRPLALQITAGDDQTGYPAPYTLAQDLQVRVTAAGAKLAATPVIPVPGVPVRFSPSDSALGAGAAPPAAVTDAAGYARTAWTLGPTLGPQTLRVRGYNPLAPTTDLFPNRAGAWDSVTFHATAVDPGPPPPPAPYAVVYLSPISKGKVTSRDVNQPGVPVQVQVCGPDGACETARRIVSNPDYQFQWKADAADLAGRYEFRVLLGDVLLGSFTGAVAKDGSALPKGVDFTFQLGSTVPIKFLLTAASGRAK